MKKLVLALLISVVATNFCSAQQNFYDITPGNGYGLRFWSSDTYKMHMGVGSEYSFGPVNDYSIKTNMDIGGGTTGRGWTWGRPGMTPVAGLNLLGNMQIAGTFQSAGNTVQGTGTLGATFQERITNGTQTLALGANLTAAEVQSQGAVPLYINYGGNNVIMNATGGNVGIGTTSPAFSLDIQGFGTRLKNTSTVANTYTSFRLQGPDYANGLEIDYFGNNNLSTDPAYSYGGGAGSAAIVNTNAKPLVLGTNNLPRVLIDASGNVGFGTTAPVRPLHINNNGGGIIRLQSTTAIWDMQSDAFYNGNFGIVNYTGGFPDATRSFMINGTTGNVGVGTANPGSYKLAVEGKIGAREVNVIATNPWPDYVFGKEYKLRSLEEIKNYIDQNNHLPEVPSAQEIEKKGVDLGEMNALLLKKIEELTLYVIELKKEIDEIKSKK